MVKTKDVLSLTLFLILFNSIGCSQTPKIHEVIYGDTSSMYLHNKEYNYWKLSNFGKLEDGTWIVYYDTQKNDTAVMVDIVQGRFNGLYREWDKEYHYVERECNYENGYRKGICHDYVYFFPDSHVDIDKDSIGVETYQYKCITENGMDIETEETVNYKTIHRSEYLKAIGRKDE